MAMRRLSISLPDDLYNAIERLSELQGASKSSVLNEFLSPALPTINNLADLLEHLLKASPEERAQIKEQMLQVELNAELQLKSLTEATRELKK